MTSLIASTKAFFVGSSVEKVSEVILLYLLLVFLINFLTNASAGAWEVGSPMNFLFVATALESQKLQATEFSNKVSFNRIHLKVNLTCDGDGKYQKESS